MYRFGKWTSVKKKIKRTPKNNHVCSLTHKKRWGHKRDLQYFKQANKKEWKQHLFLHKTNLKKKKKSLKTCTFIKLQVDMVECAFHWPVVIFITANKTTQKIKIHAWQTPFLFVLWSLLLSVDVLGDCGPFWREGGRQLLFGDCGPFPRREGDLVWKYSHSFRIVCSKNAMNLLESGEECYIKVIIVCPLKCFFP